MEKRAQFFILAAVILSAIILSFGFTVNRATVNQEPENFHDYTYEVKRESGAVIDWELYSGFDEDANLTQFVELLAADTLDKYPDAKFLFVYGEPENLTYTNYGTDDAEVNGETVPGGGAPIISYIQIDGNTVPVEGELSDYDSSVATGTISIGDNENLSITISDYSQTIYFGDRKTDKRVIFAIQRYLDGDNYVSVS
jgi:hypothetical protein